jgi:ribosomal protein S18 acetylase RimI-like enzyme
MRRRGVARSLLVDLIQTARAMGALRLSLYTIREAGNVDVFQRLGFRVVDEHIDVYFESARHACLHEAYMERDLGITR